jgi:hypothetical protein
MWKAPTIFLQLDARVQVALVLHDDPALGTGRFVAILAERFALDDFHQANLAGLVGENRRDVRVPLDQHLARLDL